MSTRSARFDRLLPTRRHDEARDRNLRHRSAVDELLRACTARDVYLKHTVANRRLAEAAAAQLRNYRAPVRLGWHTIHAGASDTGLLKVFLRPKDWR